MTNIAGKLQPLFDILDLENVLVFAKRLSANDTGASGAHQAGPYLPKSVALALSASLVASESNPSQPFESTILSHGITRMNRLVWYNQKSRDECRITCWSDEAKRNSVLQKSMTGGLFVAAFLKKDGMIAHAWVWLCTEPDEEDLIEQRIGTIEPGGYFFNGSMSGKLAGIKTGNPCEALKLKIPDAWFSQFPEGQEIVRLTFGLLAGDKSTADQKLLTRRGCEYELFLTIENQHVLPKIRQGFDSVEAFIELANSVTNRRKSRSGKSFEFHLEQIFSETALPNTRGGKTEGKKTPDFVFPSIGHYQDKSWSEEKLRMLGVKTTCKDRWRQILNEADRIRHKHLITLQEGVSVEQHQEMKAAGVILVVPSGLQKKYPEAIRSSLLSLEQFIGETKALVRQ